MAYLHSEQSFHPEELNLPVIGLASDLVQHDSGFHQHDEHQQLLYAPSGCMTLLTEDTQVILPPTRMLIIPAGLSHRVFFRNVVAYRSIYFTADEKIWNADSIKVLEVNPLLEQLIERICFWEWKAYTKEQLALVKVFSNELKAANVEDYHLKIPKDNRLINTINQFIIDKRVPPFLKELTQEVGASEKTISRVFKKETGMVYQDWRLQWKYYRSLELLAESMPIALVADELEFSSDSAFIEFFKKHSGKTPHKYLTHIPH
ncbi:helix-turn-helix transcriptional regulator [Myroides marinus]|uniref:Helix-turn-helix domain-containing protein n=1 Tax=Myroides marinus TaxID=703342 RepID=A0A1H6VC34_9FLAO|nr:helix-turn-helix transcriptional regulator [Myroides marinus]MDM1360393.1 helix-turn-helix transcriptional regulator [Myroides marinus]MDM1369141.1 helix-turn-helix transcriptional regulator [Myroides marinus]MDM1372060.1 helix-turn-helix transcriptional regulator [Myroides marinus]MDM1376005.1 helix-turn-helix transcriptional regulator [Myroides marinus]MDM1379632.1 helix-turn-helix transcriptional regulator [Myroides marinus]